MWWFNAKGVLAHCLSCGGSLLDMWCLNAKGVVAHCWICGGSLLELWWPVVEDLDWRILNVSLLYLW
jgi:hypothetical protein